MNSVERNVFPASLCQIYSLYDMWEVAFINSPFSSLFLDSWVVCVLGCPSELQTALLSAVIAHCPHDTPTPNTMLCVTLSLCALHVCVSGAPVIATIQKTSGSDDNAGGDPDQQLGLCRKEEGNVGYSFCSGKRSSTLLTLHILSLLHYTVVMQLNLFSL